MPVCETVDGFVLHEDCTKYYQCSNFVPIISDCPGGLFFNPGLGQCDFADNVTDCVGGTRDPNPGTGTTQPIIISTEPIVQTTIADRTTEAPVEPTTVAELTTAAPIETTTVADLTTQPPVQTTTTEKPVVTTLKPEPTTVPAVETTIGSGICPPTGVVFIPYPGKPCTYL